MFIFYFVSVNTERAAEPFVNNNRNPREFHQEPLYLIRFVQGSIIVGLGVAQY